MIQGTASLINKVEDPLLKALIGDVRGDSRKHKELLELVQKIENDEAVFLKGKALQVLESFIVMHSTIEENVVEVAKESIEYAKHPVSKLILEYILQDEEKHDYLLNRLEEFVKNV